MAVLHQNFDYLVFFRPYPFPPTCLALYCMFCMLLTTGRGLRPSTFENSIETIILVDKLPLTGMDLISMPKKSSSPRHESLEWILESAFRVLPSRYENWRDLTLKVWNDLIWLESKISFSRTDFLLEGSDLNPTLFWTSIQTSLCVASEEAKCARCLWTGCLVAYRRL